MGDDFNYHAELDLIPSRHLPMLIQVCVPELDEIPRILVILRERLENVEKLEDIVSIADAYVATANHLRRWSATIPQLEITETEDLVNGHEKLTSIFIEKIAVIEKLVEYQAFLECCRDFEAAILELTKK